MAFQEFCEKSPTFFVLLAVGVFPAIVILDLNGLECIIVAAGLSL